MKEVHMLKVKIKCTQISTRYIIIDFFEEFLFVAKVAIIDRKIEPILH
jgi:hypothetical protein